MSPPNAAEKPLRWMIPRWSRVTPLRREFADVFEPRFWARVTAASAVTLGVGLLAARAAWPNLALPPGFWWRSAALPAGLFAGLTLLYWFHRVLPMPAGIDRKGVRWQTGQSVTVVPWDRVEGLRLTVFDGPEPGDANRTRLRVMWRTPRGRRRVTHLGVAAGTNLHDFMRRSPAPVAVRDARGRRGVAILLAATEGGVRMPHAPPPVAARAFGGNP